jgi:prepilin-type processing-associated H-X9-DG protein
MKQIILAMKQYSQDTDEIGVPYMYVISTAGASNGAWMTYPEFIYPYLKSKDVLFCPSAERDPDLLMNKAFGEPVGSYTEAAGYKTVTTYHWASNNSYAYYGTPAPGVPGTPAAFYGSYVPDALAENPDPNYARVRSLCRDSTRPYNAFGCKGIDLLDKPADTPVLQEGFIVSKDYPGTVFGDAYGLGQAFDLSDEDNRLYMRHAGGQNIAYADGHVKFVNGKGWMRDYSARTGGRYAGNPQSPFMKVGP